MAVKPGFIYVLTHPSDSKLVKVGITTRNPKIRLKEHNTQFEKAAGKIVEESGQEWVIKECHAVEDTYNAESAYYQRSPLTEFAGGLKDEVMKLDGHIFTWDWVTEGLEAAKKAGIRSDPSQAPIPKPKPKKGAQWIEEQLEGSGLKSLNGCGNGITKVAFECPMGHLFKISGRLLVNFPFCPVCEPERFDAYTLRRVEYIKN
jgi:hypothetical protein